MWYVFQVQTHHEFSVIERCEQCVLHPGERAFTIMAERSMKRNGERNIVCRAAFPGYVFVETDMPEDLRMRFRTIREWGKMLGAGDEVIPVYPEEEEFLRRLCDEEYIIRLSRGYQKGDQLLITEGPLKGLEGNVIWVNRHQRVVGMEVNLLGHTVNVKLGCEVVKKVEG